jgi:hypothetical protein
MKLIETLAPPGWTDGTQRFEYNVSINTLKDWGGVPNVMTP